MKIGFMVQDSGSSRMAWSLALLALVLGAGLASAQPYAVSWFKIAGGGGTSTGGVFTVSGTIGQPEAGNAMTTGPYAVTGGFWPGVNLVQTPGAPLLNVEQIIGGSVRIFWLRPATGFVLDQSPTVTGAWSQVSFPYTTNATDISITVPAPAGNKFYRLRKP